VAATSCYSLNDDSGYHAYLFQYQLALLFQLLWVLDQCVHPWYRGKPLLPVTYKIKIEIVFCFFSSNGVWAQSFMLGRLYHLCHAASPRLKFLKDRHGIRSLCISNLFLKGSFCPNSYPHPVFLHDCQSKRPISPDVLTPQTK
jgi:hypothetical protein